MAITQRDVMLLFTMGLAVVSMSFVFPALGLGGQQVAESEVPELSIDEDRFDFAGDAPAPPSSTGSGRLSWFDNRSDQFNQVFANGGTTNGIEIGLLPPTSTRPLQISIARWESSSLAHEQQINLTSEGDTAIIANETIGLTAEFEVLRYDDTAPREFVVSYDVRSVEDVGGGGGGWISGISIGEIAAVVGWIGETIVWALLFVFGLIVNAVVVSAEVGIYFVRLITWLAGAYTAIVSAANSWAAVFVALPGILLSVVLGKFVIVGISLLPTT